MNEEFKKAFDSLSYAYKKIIAQVIRMMDKTHKFKKPKKIIRVKAIVDYYRKQKGLKQRELIDKLSQNDPAFSEDTYMSILKRNLVNVKDNATMKSIEEVLGISVDSNGIPYILRKLPDTGNSSIIDKTEYKQYYYTKETSNYMLEFQIDDVYNAFKKLNENNKKAVLYLVHSLNNYTIAPDVFENDEDE
jgi:hypothetical protein